MRRCRVTAVTLCTEHPTALPPLDLPHPTPTQPLARLHMLPPPPPSGVGLAQARAGEGCRPASLASLLRAAPQVQAHIR